MSKEADGVHFNSAPKWGSWWRLHCNRVCRRYPSPPTCADGQVVYEFFSWPADGENLAHPVVIWVILSEEQELPWLMLRHKQSSSRESYLDCWPELDSVARGKDLVIWDLVLGQLVS